MTNRNYNYRLPLLLIILLLPCYLPAQNVLSVFAQDDFTETTQDVSISIDVSCNDYQLTDTEEAANLLLGHWKLQYLSGGFAGLDPYLVPEEEEFLFFTSDSLIGTSLENFGYDFSYTGAYTFTEDFVPGVDLLELQNPSPFFTDQALILELSDSILVINDAAQADGFDKHFVRTNLFEPVLISQPLYGSAVVFDGQIIYDPAPGFVGLDTFQYQICDASDTICDIASVNIFVSEFDTADATPTVTGSTNTIQIWQDNLTMFFNPSDYFTFDLGDDLTFVDYSDPDCGDLVYEPGIEQLIFTATTENFCSFYFIMCNNDNVCDTSFIDIEVLCYPWDYPVEQTIDTVGSLSLNALLPILNNCSDDANILLESSGGGTVTFNPPFLSYTPEPGFLGNDTIYYYVDQLDIFGCFACGEYIQHIIHVEEEQMLNVWPGDANANGTVNMYDLLNVGLRYGIMGPERSMESFDFSGMQSQEWVTSLNGLNDKHVDCNGDGIINTDDVFAIDANYNNTYFDYLPEGDPLVLAGIQSMSMEFAADTVSAGSTVTFNVEITDDGNPLLDVYGFAFQLSYDTAFVNEASISVDFSNSYLEESGNTPELSIAKDFYNQGTTDISFCRTSMTNITGPGVVCAITLIVEENLDGKMQTLSELEIGISGGVVINSEGQASSVAPFTQSIIIDSDLVDGVKPVAAGGIEVSPQPVNDWLFINSSKSSIQQIALHDISGRLLVNEQTGGTNSSNIDTGSLQTGMYILYIVTSDGSAYQSKVLISR